MKFTFFVVLACIACSCMQARTRPMGKQISAQLSPAESETLEQCFRWALTTAELGAVLFGKKPVCGVGQYSAEVVSLASLSSYESWDVAIYSQGVAIWERLRLPSNANFSFVRNKSNSPFMGCLFINHKAVLEVVDEHLGLFREVLGDHITPEGLLAELIRSEEPLFSFLKHSNVLVGIILGYGGENARLHTRAQEILLLSMSVETLPLKNRNERLGFERFIPIISCEPYITKWSTPPKSEELDKPDHFSITEAYKEINRAMAVSWDLDKRGNALPCFGCYKDSEETKRLIKRYAKAADKTERLINSKHFLQDVLSILCE